MTQTLYRFYWDVQRHGEIESLFIADDEQVAAVLGMDIYLGEVLGKHSDISGTLDAEDLLIITQEPGIIADLRRVFSGAQTDSYRFRNDTLCGINPLNYLRDEAGDDVEFPLKLTP